MLKVIEVIESEIDELEVDEDKFNLTYTTKRIVKEARNERYNKIKELKEKYLSE